LPVHGVADLALQRSARFLVRLAVGDLAVEVDTAVGVGLAQLADRGHVDGVVQLAVAAFGESVHDATTRGELDRGGAVVRGVVITVAEPGDVAAVAR
jgi:hypothetical protein